MTKTEIISNKYISQHESVGADCVFTWLPSMCTAHINILSRTIVRDCKNFGTQLFKQTLFCGPIQAHNFEMPCCHEQTSVDFKHYCH